MVPDTVTFDESNLALRDALRVMPGGRGECGARGRGFINPAPGRLGHQPAGTMTGARGASLDGDSGCNGRVGQVPGSLARVAPRDDHSLGKSRGGTPAGERARERKGRRKPPYPWRDPRAACVRGLTTVRLPAFRFPYVPEASL
jgi:hypothetical protein